MNELKTELYILLQSIPTHTEPETREPVASKVISGSSIYSKDMCFNKEWFHGELTRVEAEQALSSSNCDCFLIRECERGLVLSLTHRKQVDHVTIKYGPGWYELKGGSAQRKFPELDDLVSYYQRNGIRRNLNVTLGMALGQKAITSGHCVSVGELYMPLYLLHQCLARNEIKMIHNL